ncbi:hypothetical protein VPH35_108639 [Triticum aestivum]|uniref:uncharacterized protein n=1 Tax=Triticum aestivum TaxID=4565 RepID=UPI0003D437A0|nr:uncharacterized protein LOC123133439 [Triticum aestivum]XP_044408866.1 uncharacterized protein LOC123133442 [Triticum aestivum]
MEVKRAATIAALCMLLIMSVPSQQRVAAMSFCDCYRQCYPGCRQSVPWWLCNVNCAGNCDVGDREDSLAACIMVCSTDSVCGPVVAPTYAQGVADCIAECNKRWGNN